MYGHKDCEGIRELIVEWNHISNEEREAVLEHIETCSSCRKFFEEERALDSILSRWRIEVRRKTVSVLRALTVAFVTSLIFIMGILLSLPKGGKYTLFRGEEIWVLGKGKVQKVILYGSFPEETIKGEKKGTFVTVYFIPVPGVFKTKGG